MEGTLFPTALFLGLGIVAAVILWLAAKYLSVPQDELQVKIREKLPGVNCGACGFAGCDDYAAQLATGTVECTRCIPGGPSVAKELSILTGKEQGTMEEKKAFVSCCGTEEGRCGLLEYKGIETCAACNMFYSGKGLCDFACLGYGDCVAACPFEAITICDGLPKVDREACTGCGLCAKACPNSLIQILPDSQKYAVACSSPRPGAQTRKDCKNGCIGCGKCVQTCPAQAISMEGSLAKIDGSKCVGCGACAKACPVGVIHELSHTK